MKDALAILQNSWASVLVSKRTIELSKDRKMALVIRLFSIRIK